MNAIGMSFTSFVIHYFVRHLTSPISPPNPLAPSTKCSLRRPSYLDLTIPSLRRKQAPQLHLRLQLLVILSQSIHVLLPCRPMNAQSFLLTRFGDHMEMHVIDYLMRQPAVILQDVVLRSSSDLGKLFGNRLLDGVVQSQCTY